MWGCCTKEEIPKMQQPCFIQHEYRSSFSPLERRKKESKREAFLEVPGVSNVAEFDEGTLPIDPCKLLG